MKGGEEGGLKERLPASAPPRKGRAGRPSAPLPGGAPAGRAGRVSTEKKAADPMNTDRNGSVWTGERILALRRLWSEGHTTAEIGRRMGVSKNAVVGKAHRLDLPARPTPIRRPDTGIRPTPRRIERPPVPPLAALVRLGSCPDEPTAARTSPIAPCMPVVLGITACRWPVGDPRAPGFRFCDDPTLARRPYCAAHQAAAYRTTPPEALSPLI